MTKNPKVDSTDFYMFNSYEPGRSAFVTLLANYQPFQENFGGPNYYEMDPEALYEIHIDNNGDGVEDVTFQFNFHHALINGGAGITLPIDLDGGAVKTNSVPLLNIGGITIANNGTAVQVSETYDLTVVQGPRRTGTATTVVNSQGKPVDYIGSTSLGVATTYENYAKSFKASFNIPGCDTPANVWAGQRREGFAANIGVVFDLIQSPNIGGLITTGSTVTARGLNATNPNDTGVLYNKNISTLALEVPAACLTGATGSGIIGGWTSASMRQARVLNPNANFTTPSKEGGAWTQVSHLGMPLVNEVVIGLHDKDTFSAVSPVSTSAVADYVTNPTLPKLIEVLYGAASPAVRAPTAIRTDLVGTFATGLTLKNHATGADFNLNQTSTGPGNPGPAGNTLPTGIYEYLRLNTHVQPTDKTTQVNNGDARGLGAMACINEARELDLTATGCDPAGFPNGRRPGDDVVDIVLRVAMGALIADATVAPGHDVPFTDINYNGPEQFDAAFPYLRTPLAGNVNPNVDSNTITQK